jgi:prepilin-type N-terminal cleavage/methylation domain-containing protein
MTARGSTLLELVVVLALVALLFGVAIPALTATPAAQDRAAADNLRWAAVAAGAPRVNDSLLALPDGRTLARGGERAR